MYMAGHEPRILHEEILDELRKARIKFPTRYCPPETENEDLLAMLAALVEEVGELSQAIIQWLYEPEKEKTYKDIRNEAVQVATMAMRVMLDTKLAQHSLYEEGQQ